QIEALSGLVEEMSACGLETPKARAEVDAVQVFLEDTVLVELPLDAQGDQNFLELTAQRARSRDQVACELLGDGAGAGHDPAVPQSLSEGPQHGERIDPGMLAEAGVLGGQHRGRHVIGELSEFDASRASPGLGTILVEE